MAITFNAAWAGFSLHVAPPLAANAYAHLEFWIYGNGRALTLFTQPSDNGPASPAYQFTPAANTWTLISVPLATFGSPSAIARITLQDDSGAAQPTFYLDTIRLMAAETLAHRVHIYPPDSTAATVIIGQYGADCPAGTLTFYFPRGVALDSNGRLLVADQFHHRVLIFTPPFASGMNASGVIGQSSLTACEPNGGAANPTNQSSLWGPRGVALDNADNLFVADSENNRVLQFTAPLPMGRRPPSSLASPISAATAPAQT